MSSQYVQRATIAVSEAHIADGNQLALCLGESAADDQTFGTARYQDSSGNLYSVCSTVAKPVFGQMAGQPLVAPDHAPEMDLDAATRAQALLRINDGPASPGAIAVIMGARTDPAQLHIKVLGLEPVPTEVP